MYRVGAYKVWKPDRKSRSVFNIEMGATSYGIGMDIRQVKHTSGLGPHRKEEFEEGVDDEVCILQDGRVLLCANHKDN